MRKYLPVVIDFIKLLERFIKVLAAVFSIEVLQVSLRSSFNFKSEYIALSLTAILMQNNFFSQVINCK